MKYKSDIILKNGDNCVIRNAEASDAQAVYDTFNLTHEETDYLLSYPDENRLSVEQERRFLAELEQNDRETELCAVVGGRIVGTAGIEAVGKTDKVKHRAEFGIGIEQNYWGMGIGRALLMAGVECAQRAGYTQLELDVVADNLAAIALYQSVGFIEFGRNPKGFCSRKAGWQELILMRLELNASADQ